MTLYRCMNCGGNVEVEEILNLNTIEVTPCEKCIRVLAEEGEDLCYEEGFERGYNKAYEDIQEESDVEKEEE